MNLFAILAFHQHDSSSGDICCGATLDVDQFVNKHHEYLISSGNGLLAAWSHSQCIKYCCLASGLTLLSVTL